MYENLVRQLVTAGQPDQSGYVLPTKQLTDDAAVAMEHMNAVIKGLSRDLKLCEEKHIQEEYRRSIGHHPPIKE